MGKNCQLKRGKKEAERNRKAKRKENGKGAKREP